VISLQIGLASARSITLIKDCGSGAGQLWGFTLVLELWSA